MMGWVGNLFGTEKAVDNLVDKDNGLLVRAGTAIGNLHYSDQEKAESDERTREWGIRLLDALAPFKVVQRIIAFTTLGIWAILSINIIVAYWVRALTTTVTRSVNVVNGEEVITTVVTSIDAVSGLYEFALTDYVFWPVLAVLSLYTGGGTINSLRGGK